jgi:hypothetical protein
MKVKQLIEILKAHDPEDEVHIGYNYGDYWRTQVAPEVKHVNYLPVKHSGYHNMPKVHELYDDESDEPNDNYDHMAVVLEG